MACGCLATARSGAPRGPAQSLRLAYVCVPCLAARNRSPLPLHRRRAEWRPFGPSAGVLRDDVGSQRRLQKQAWLAVRVFLLRALVERQGLSFVCMLKKKTQLGVFGLARGRAARRLTRFARGLRGVWAAGPGARRQMVDLARRARIPEPHHLCIPPRQR